MELSELKKAIEEMKATGATEEDILGTFYVKFAQGEISLNEFESLVGLLGRGLSDEFKSLGEDEQKKYALVESDGEDDGEGEGEEDGEPETESEEEEEKRAMKILNAD